MSCRTSRAAVVALALCLPASAHAATGVCDSNQPTTTQACTDAVQNAGAVVNDIFRDANNRTGPQLPTFGQLFNVWPGCDLTSWAGCAGQDLAPADCPGQYACNAASNTFATASAYANSLDHLWWHPCRLSDHSMNGACPQFGTCVADGDGQGYFPWEGSVFDLGGPSNKVVIFATNDHGPQPCESLEYTVYLTDNPFSREQITQPAVTGVDPTKWNRAVLSTVFTHGWYDTRAPDPAGHAACGDTAQYPVEQDSFVQVFSLPCGITFRYAAIIAGNDGLDFASCGFDSSEAELDAVAGLTENGAGVCPDADDDHFVDCLCPGAPPVCDCNDADPTIHPGAPEPCDAPDMNCDGVPGGCDAGLTCYQSLCMETCTGEFSCPVGADCTSTTSGNLCVPESCNIGGCPPGSACVNNQCVPDCQDVVCPSGQECRDGACIDQCEGVVCPSGQLCDHGACGPPCTCLTGADQCAATPGSVCDPDGSCVAPLCVGVTCPSGEHCDGSTGTCVGPCTPDVSCPAGQQCLDPGGCTPRCDGVTCTGSDVCDPSTGLCTDPLCIGVTCTPPEMCVLGACSAPGPDAGNGGDGGGNPATDGGNGSGGGKSGGCCDAGDDGASGAALLLFAVVLGLRRRPSGRRAARSL